MSQLLQDAGAASPVVKKSPGRDCIVFLPGIGESSRIDQTVEGLAHVLASTLALNAEDRTATFSSKVHAIEDLSLCKGEVGTIYRNDEQGDNPIIDIYRLDYRGTLVERYEKRNLLVKTLQLLLVLPGGLFRVLRAMLPGRSAKTRAEKFQLFYALGILCLLVVYVAILFGAVWATVQDSSRISSAISSKAKTAGDSPNSTPATTPAPETNKKTVLVKFSQAVVVLWAAIGLFLPPKFNLKDTISKAAVDYVCLIYYLKFGEQRNLIVGRLETLIDKISQRSENERKKGTGKSYDQIHLFAYSFGSIVALDTMFPAGREPGRPLEAVDTLVTIGCPFDFVRALWPSYFDARREYDENRRVRWLNIYSPLDTLGSNFRNDPRKADANINIRAEQIAPGSDVPAPINVPFKEGLDLSELSWMSSFTLIGLRAHALYWSVKNEGEVTCFNDLVKRMYGREGILG
jgi:hypothetical protein